MNVDKLDSMKVFLEVAKRQSFVGAGEYLNMSAPAVTRSVADLEHRLGVKLFNRTTRRVRLTESGQQYLIDAQRILQDIAESEASILGNHAKPMGTLTITAPVMFGQLHVMPIVSEYLEVHENVDVKAYYVDSVSRMLEDEIEVAIRIGQLKDSNLYATKVGKVKQVLCASPSYLEKWGEPKQPSDLHAHQIIHATTFENTSTWQFKVNGRIEKCTFNPRFRCNQNGAVLHAALQGLGITRLMSYQVNEYVKSGELCILLPKYEEAELPVNIIHLEGRRENARVQAFIQLATERLRANPNIH